MSWHVYGKRAALSATISARVWQGRPLGPHPLLDTSKAKKRWRFGSRWARGRLPNPAMKHCLCLPLLAISRSPGWRHPGQPAMENTIVDLDLHVVTISQQKMGSKSVQSSPLLLHPCSPRRLCGGGCGLVGDQVALVSVGLVSLAVWLLLDALVGFSATASTATPKWKMPQGGGGRCLKPQGGGGRNLKTRPHTLCYCTLQALAPRGGMGRRATTWCCCWR